MMEKSKDYVLLLIFDAHLIRFVIGMEFLSSIFRVMRMILYKFSVNEMILKTFLNSSFMYYVYFVIISYYNMPT